MAMNSVENQFATLSTLFFALALFHSFAAGKISSYGTRFPEGSIAENFFHLMGEVEIVFGLWSGVWIIGSILIFDFKSVTNYLNDRNFTEALFVFVIMAICSTRPLLLLAENTLLSISKMIPLPSLHAKYIVILILGPLLGSFITEPAAMTICAYLLRPLFMSRNHGMKFKYATLGLLFVNISIGGTLTPFAAPPILIVAQTWNWDLQYMLTHFAPKTIATIFIGTLIVSFIFRRELGKISESTHPYPYAKPPFWIILIHLVFLGLIVITAHYPILFIGLFLFFIGFLRTTREYQVPLQLREPLLVGFFLGGLIILGGLQSWWLQPLVGRLSEFQLFIGSIALTAITDNAALTYLGSLIENLPQSNQWSLAAGSVIGGGLTLIANAPNPAGYGILREAFEENGFNPIYLAFGALPLTILAALLFQLIPSFG